MTSEKKQLVKTGKEIALGIINSPNGEAFIYKMYRAKFLILPDGLNALEEMLKEETKDAYISENCSTCKGHGTYGPDDCPTCNGKGYINERSKVVPLSLIPSIFARFKKETGL
ncbi:MAG: hypothetical protein IMZ53_08330 [Thermoplasmata archaeon]|nr:hypothetical protein [Thermoplasmata archaeon]MBE3140575.1 hypothetical protein [Thermoplasmata archaeon]